METFHEGWLIKSPPLGKWKARWRRRWFTLKQGELPGQFFLEYYTDRNCRKLKGIIDLDQCEQVDAGLRMCSRKHKLPFMFLVKTHKREYYLGADTDEELRGWVNCICQVCGLQDLTKENDNKNFYNAEPNTSASSSDINTFNNTKDLSNETQLTELNSTTFHIDNQLDNLSIHNTYQNDDFTLRNAEYTNRETLLCDEKFEQQQQQQYLQQQQQKSFQLNDNKNPFKTNNNNLFDNNFENYSNFSTIREVNNQLNNKTINRTNINDSNTNNHIRNHQSSSSSGMVIKTTSSGTGTIKKIPENLKLPENMNEFIENSKPSPSLSTSSGPYIPISECFSGSPILPPTNLLNSMDPKFYDTPRNHHINIGLNLTNDQPYSPKRNNCPIRCQDSSPTDSESVFTDDEWSQTESFQGTLERNLRPSDSSIENEAIGWTYVQRFSKVPNDDVTLRTGAPPRPPKRISTLVLDELERFKDKECSDTENASPAIGPKDSSSYLEQSYDIPRSHRLPYYLNNNNSISPKQIITSLTTTASTTNGSLSSKTSSTSTLTGGLNYNDITAQSTPNLLALSTNGGYVTKQNCYTNAAPTLIDGSIFRYDFYEQPEAPAVNRSLKPKSTTIGGSGTLTRKDIKSNEIIVITPTIINTIPTTTITMSTMNGNNNNNNNLNESITSNSSIKSPPNINRKLKPMTPKFDTNSMRKISLSGKLGEQSDEDIGSLHELPQMFFQEKHFHARTGSMTNQMLGASKSEDKLQYLDLDHSNSQSQKTNKIGDNTTKTLSNTSLTKSMPRYKKGASTTEISTTVRQRSEDSGIVYKTVDFLKTEAFKKVKEESEITRQKETASVKETKGK